MTANELRIGNWVYNHAGRPAQVTRIEETKTPLCQPIPLTEEWLLKFGWIWNEDCNSYEKYPNGDVRMNLQFRDVSGSYVMFNYILKAMIADKIYYVHQLQNLYFALTNEELTIQ